MCVLVRFGLLLQNTIDLGGLLVSYNSGGWEVLDCGTSMARFWWRPSFGLQAADFLLYAHVVEGAGRLGIFYKGTNPICEGTTLMT